MPIDRPNLVRRHAVTLRAVDRFSPLTVGNGEFAFTADVTGLQTFPDAYSGAVPLCTMSQWGWHGVPAGPGVTPGEIRYTDFDTHGRPVPYLTSATGQEATFDWLRQNPHRLHLGRIGFRLRTAGGRDATIEDVTAIEQTLDPYAGRLVSRFDFDGHPVHVETVCAGDTDAVAVRVRSPLLADGRLAIELAFPYGNHKAVAADWTKPAAHQTTIEDAQNDPWWGRPAPASSPVAERGRDAHTTRAAEAMCGVRLLRVLDDTRYYVGVAWEGAGQFVEAGPHHFRLSADKGATELAATFVFSREPAIDVPTFDQAAAASDAMWADYWHGGAAVEFAGSVDPRAHELERRVVLSQYLMRANCAGSLPPAETGLTCNSWYGKFHLEMHWWHGVHFALWGRLPLLQRSLSYYRRILPEAKKIAERQGYRGVRWPKMVDARGVDSPSPVGPLLLWQQPHPVYYAELCYRQSPTRETLEAWQTIVDGTAEFMASFAVRDAATGHYVLGPPVKSVQENNDTNRTRNPTYELTYWRFGLRVAQQWRERLGQSRNAAWDDVLHHLAPAPHDGERYLLHDGLAGTYDEWSWEHPAVVGALGMLDGDGIDAGMMRRSLEKTMAVWQWDRCWGWDFPMTAMCAARVGRPDLAVDALFIGSKKNTYAASGHVFQRADLPLYLPANGGLLAAVAMMAGGWTNGPTTPAPGFPDGWTVKAEGLKKML